LAIIDIFDVHFFAFVILY